MLRRWTPSGVLVLCGFAICAVTRPGWLATVLLVVFLWAALLMSPRPFPRSVPDAQARLDGRPIVYWRPGCPFCLRLRLRLRTDAQRLIWVDIWADPEGAASVRAVTGGDETVPTVVAGDRSLVNPDVSQVRALLAAL